MCICWNVIEHQWFLSLNQNELKVISQAAMIGFDFSKPSRACETDKSLSLVKMNLIESLTFAGQGGMISVETGLEAVVVLADWSEPVKGLRAAASSSSCGLQRLSWLSSFSGHTDHSAAAALQGHNLHWTGNTLQAQSLRSRLLIW